MNLPTNGQWQAVTTTAVDTIMQVRKSRVMITTVDPNAGGFNEDDDAIEITDHVQMRGLFVVPEGLSVWARCVSAAPDGTCKLSMMPWGT